MKSLTLRLFVAITLVWTVILTISLGWNIYNNRLQTMDEAYAEARTSLNKDISFRRWASDHGGVYVPVTQTQKPVPWLSHVPNRDITSTDGHQLTLLNPASVLRQVMDRYTVDYRVRGRIVGLKQLNPANAPDDWERRQLEAFLQGEKKEVLEIADIDAKPYLRYLLVMMMEPGCDKCHAILGYKTGDMRGATGLSLPLDRYFAKIHKAKWRLGLTHFGIWAVGLFGIGMAWQANSRQETKRRTAEIGLQETSSRYQAIVQSSNDAIVTADQLGNIVGWNRTAEILFGYKESEVISKPLTLLMPKKFREPHQTGFNNILAGEDAKMIGQTAEVTGLRKDGTEFSMALSLAKWKTSAGYFFSGTIRDITSIKAHEQQLKFIAHYDTLTKLPNRILLADRLHQAMSQSTRRNLGIGVAYIDIDGFKPVNDTHGHNVGDELLITISERMALALREGDTLARIGGDEFIVILVDLDGPMDYEPILERLLLSASEPVKVDNALLHVSASIGMTVFPEDNVDADMLMRHADHAMYSAKQAGKNRYHLFDINYDVALTSRHESQAQICSALRRGEFVLHYQPKVNMRTGEIIGAEALIRWQHPQRGILPPAEFLPIIEDHIVSIELGEWVIDTTLSQMDEWHSTGLNIPVSVNVGALQLQQSDFVSRLSTLLAAHPCITPNQLELEILETSALEDVAQISKLMHSCHAMGIHFSLDDFGTGYSSLTYLKRLPVEMLKIDQSFVRDMLDDTDDMAIVEGVVGLASAFRRRVIAEGVETVEHGVKLLKLGCFLAQGYGIARPMPASEMPDWVANWQPDASWTEAVLEDKSR